jgi:hypothetical protein
MEMIMQLQDEGSWKRKVGEDVGCAEESSRGRRSAHVLRVWKCGSGLGEWYKNLKSCCQPFRDLW